MSSTATPVVKNSVSLTNSTTVAEAVTLVSQGKIEQVALVEWLCSTPIDLAQANCLIGVLDAATFGEVLTAQQRLIAAAARKAAGGGTPGEIRVKVAKKGGVSLYGINTRMPVTLYAEQWERLLKWLNAPADNPVSTFINSSPVGSFAASDYKTPEELEWLASRPAHVAVNGSVVTVNISRKA